MTGAAFREVDFDLLADYVGGALDGTPEHAEVASLVADDPAWSQAHRELLDAMAAVRADLSALGAATGPMPTDVEQRLTAALADANDDRASEDGEPAAESYPLGRTAVPGRSTARRRATRRRWAPRWAAPIAVAAGVLAFAGFGVSQLTGSANEQAGSAASAPMADQPGDAEGVRGPQPATALGGEAGHRSLPDAAGRITAGGDYRRGDLGARAQTNLSYGASEKPTRQFDASGGAVVDEDVIDPALRRLADRPALSACLDAITTARGGDPVAVQAIEFARFEGRPALIVWFDADDEQWVWVSGPACGTRAGDPDTRYSKPVR